MSNPSITADKTPWYQWDTVLTVTVSGGAMTECHFANRKQGTAYVQAVINGVARVPDELLQVAAPIKAYGYVSDGAGGQTYVEQTFDVIARNIPSDYTYTKTAQKTIRDAEAARDEAVQAAKDAKASELAADDSAVEASKSAQSAGESASAAANSASNAAKSAGEAAKSASDAKAAADKAVEDASAQLKTYTDNAKTSADNAATSASNAESSATAAAKSASDAAASVGAINVIAPKTVDVAASSEIDGSVAVGAGSVAKKENELSIGNDTLTREITHVSEPTNNTSASTKKYTDDNDDKTLRESKKYTDDNTSNALVGTVSGKLLHVEDAWPGKPLSLTIEGACKQDGTPSPEAPVPITVVENPTLKVTGRNFWDKGVVVYDYIIDYLKYNADASVTLEPGTYTISSNGKLPSLQFFEPGSHKQLTCAEATDMDGANIRYRILWDGYSISPLNDNVRVLTITLTRAVEMTGCVVNDQGTWIQVEHGTNATVYAPYAGTSLPITLPAEHPYLAALPDGTHDEIVIDKDVNASLVARVRRIIIAKDGKWRYEKTGGGASIYYIENDGKNKTVGLTPCAVGRYAYAPNSVFVGSGGYPTLVDGDETDANGVIDKFGENNPVYYQLETPVTYNLGKLDIPALPETISNVWTDAELTTNMSMTYKRDINIAFDNLVQAVVAAAAGE